MKSFLSFYNSFRIAYYSSLLVDLVVVGVFSLSSECFRPMNSTDMAYFESTTWETILF